MHFSHEAQSAYSILLPRSLDTFQSRTYSAQFPLPREHSLPGIAAFNTLLLILFKLVLSYCSW